MIKNSKQIATTYTIYVIDEELNDLALLTQKDTLEELVEYLSIEKQVIKNSINKAPLQWRHKKIEVIRDYFQKSEIL